MPEWLEGYICEEGCDSMPIHKEIVLDKEHRHKTLKECGYCNNMEEYKPQWMCDYCGNELNHVHQVKYHFVTK